VIKVNKHRLTCECEACLAMFPAKRFEAIWNLPDPEVPGAVFARAPIPIGVPKPALLFGVWCVAAEVAGFHRLVVDWPGFPGTAGALVVLSDKDPPAITATPDPLLGALHDDVPLRREVATRFNARCMVEFGVAEPDAADFVACETHGHGLAALACHHVVGQSPMDVVVLYSVDGDFPDLLCEPCLARYAGGDLDATVTVCSRCQREHVHRHRVVARTHDGAVPTA
jgi:hypothetical protein